MKRLNESLLSDLIARRYGIDVERLALGIRESLFAALPSQSSPKSRDLLDPLERSAIESPATTASNLEAEAPCGSADLLTFERELEREIERRVLAHACIGESHFLRHPEDLAALRAAAPKTQKLLRIWSAGCATGEEAYTLASLFGTGSEPHITATDLNPTTLQYGRNGLYRAWSLRGLDPSSIPWLRPVKLSGELNFQVTEELRRLIDFRVDNLLGPASDTDYDIIVCRNVFIYFTPEAQSAVLRRFLSQLKPGGLLLLGPCDLHRPLPVPWRRADARASLWRKAVEMTRTRDSSWNRDEPTKLTLGNPSNSSIPVDRQRAAIAGEPLNPWTDRKRSTAPSFEPSCAAVSDSKPLSTPSCSPDPVALAPLSGAPGGDARREVEPSAMTRDEAPLDESTTRGLDLSFREAAARAFQLMVLEDWAKARDALLAALDLKPCDDQILAALVFVDIDRRDLISALGWADHYRLTRPGDSMGPLLRARVLLSQGEFVAARSALDGALDGPDAKSWIHCVCTDTLRSEIDARILNLKVLRFDDLGRHAPPETSGVLRSAK